MDMSALGKMYRDGEEIVRQGESGDCMYVIQAGRAEVVRSEAGKNPAWPYSRKEMSSVRWPSSIRRNGRRLFGP